MAADVPTPDPRRAWQRQPVQPFRFSPAALQARVARSRRRLRMLSLAQRTGGLVAAVISWVAVAVSPDAAMRGSATVMAVMMSALFVMWTKPFARARAAPSDGDPSVGFLRAELARHRDRDRGLALWARFGIGMPVAIVFCLTFARAYPALSRFIYLELAAICIVLPVVFLSARRRSRRYDREIAELDALQSPESLP